MHHRSVKAVDEVGWSGADVSVNIQSAFLLDGSFGPQGHRRGEMGPHNDVTGLGDGPLARAGVRPGDVIIRIADADITGVKQFEGLVKALDPNKSVPVFVRRADSTLIIPVRPK